MTKFNIKGDLLKVLEDWKIRNTVLNAKNIEQITHIIDEVID